METFKKIAKIVCIVLAISAAVCGVIVAVKQIKAKRESLADSEENYARFPKISNKEPGLPRTTPL